MLQVQGIGHQLGRGVGRPADPGAELSGRELTDLRGALTTETTRLLSTRQRRGSRVEPALVVHDGPLVGDAEQVDLGAAGALGARLGVGEELVLAHRLQRLRPGHETSQALPTDSPPTPGTLAPQGIPSRSGHDAVTPTAGQRFLWRGFLAGAPDEEPPRGPSSFLRPISLPEMRVERSASQVSAGSSAGSSTSEKSGRMLI